MSLSISPAANLRLFPRNLDELLEYMDGSAAVVGEVMVRVLMQDNTEQEREAAVPHAMDLGLAFQLTNMLRDVAEDRLLGRLYLPADLAKDCGVDLRTVDANHPGWPRLMDRLMELNGKHYR